MQAATLRRHPIPRSSRSIPASIVIGDSIPGLKYIQRGDSLIFWGTGDPSFLYKNVQRYGGASLSANGSRQPVFLAIKLSHRTFWGGLVWDDYRDYYSPERSPLPVYGNIATVAIAGNTAILRRHILTTTSDPASFGPNRRW